jgi:hypothetical protein
MRCFIDDPSQRRIKSLAVIEFETLLSNQTYDQEPDLRIVRNFGATVPMSVNVESTT